MYEIDETFEEVALCIGKDEFGKRQNIALISGRAICSINDCDDWELEYVFLYGPLRNDVEVKIDHRHPLWECICESVTHDCGDRLWDITREIVREAAE